MSTIIPQADQATTSVRHHHTPKRRALASKWVDLLRDGDTRGNYDKPWAAVVAYANACIAAGHSRADFMADILNPRNTLHDGIRYKSDGRTNSETSIIGQANRAWQKARAHQDANPPARRDREAAITELARIRKAADETPDWAGRSGLRDRIILEALLDTGVRLGTIRPTISVRTLCERSPYKSIGTIVRAVRSLHDKGWLTAERPTDQHDSPSAYLLHTKRRGVQPESNTGASWREQDPVHLLHPRGQLSNDLSLALTPHAAAVHATLSTTPQSKNNVVRRSGVSKRTVDKWLAILARRGLARQDGEGRWLCGDTSVTTVALEDDVLTVVERRSKRHELQREGFRQWHADRAAERDHRRAGRHSHPDPSTTEGQDQGQTAMIGNTDDQGE